MIAETYIQKARQLCAASTPFDQNELATKCGALECDIVQLVFDKFPKGDGHPTTIREFSKLKDGVLSPRDGSIQEQCEIAYINEDSSVGFH